MKLDIVVYQTSIVGSVADQSSITCKRLKIGILAPILTTFFPKKEPDNLAALRSVSQVEGNTCNSSHNIQRRTGYKK
jgi:hypothetical protein